MTETLAVPFRAKKAPWLWSSCRKTPWKIEDNGGEKGSQSMIRMGEAQYCPNAPNLT